MLPVSQGAKIVLTLAISIREPLTLKPSLLLVPSKRIHAAKRSPRFPTVLPLTQQLRTLLPAARGQQSVRNCFEDQETAGLAARSPGEASEFVLWGK